MHGCPANAQPFFLRRHLSHWFLITLKQIRNKNVTIVDCYVCICSTSNVALECRLDRFVVTIVAVVESKFMDFLYTYVVFIPMPLRGKPKIN